MSLDNYQRQTADWRAHIKENERKTKIVIASFILLYVFIGLLVDVFLGLHHYGASSGQIFFALITLKITPYATMVMGGIAAVSLWVTYSMYDTIMLLGTDSYEVTAANAANVEEKQLYNVVEEMKVAAGLNYMPKVYIINADYMNAFASGYSEKSAMVAITRGLMTKLNRDELQAVMAHELSHIRHHDIKLTLTVAVLTNIMLIVIDMLFYNLLYSSRSRRRDNNSGGANGLFLAVMVLRFVLPFITAMLALFLSRSREYMADAGAVELMRTNEPMASALMKITYDHRDNAEQYQEEYGKTAHEDVRRASYVYDPSRIDPVHSLNSAFSTHPSLEERLKALGFHKKKSK